MKYAIITSKQDPAGRNMKKHLEALGFDVHETEKEIVYAENIDKEVNADFLVFASKHQSRSKIPSLSVHPIGNWEKADMGGKSKKLCYSMPGLMKRAYLLMKQKQPRGFDVIYEATHHGPFVEKPAMFIEIGSTEKEWNNPELGKLMAGIIKEMLEYGPVSSKPAVCLGGPHTCTNFLKAVEKSDYSIAHCCPKHSLKYLNKDMMQQAFEKSYEKPEIVILDWKGLGKNKEQIKDLLNGINFIRVDKINC